MPMVTQKCTRVFGGDKLLGPGVCFVFAVLDGLVRLLAACSTVVLW